MKIDGARSMKRIFKFTLGLLINACILFVLVRVFSSAFGFAYDVFSTSCKDASDKQVRVVEILPDSSIAEVCETLNEAGVVKNHYALMVKIRIGSFAAKIVPGTYEIAPSYTNDEIITIITGGTLEK